MSRFYRPLVALAAAGACAFPAGPASSGGVRYVTVVNLMTVSTTATLLQHGTVAVGTIEPKRDRFFDIPPGVTVLSVVSSACQSGKRITLPPPEHVRVVVNAGCALSIQ